MSIKYMQRVWAVRELRGGSLLVMLALADHANDAGECWPSQKHLAEKARLDERQVRRVIGILVKDSHVAIKDRRADHGKKTKYQLFPADTEPAVDEQKADKMSGREADILSEKKRTKCPADKMSSGHLAHEKADISSQNYSHARSESPIEPSGGDGISSSDSGDSAIAAKWQTCLSELERTLPRGFLPTVIGSRIERDGDVSGIPRYRVLIAKERAQAGLNHFTHQAGPAIRRKWGGILGRQVLIEIVAAEREEESIA